MTNVIEIKGLSKKYGDLLARARAWNVKRMPSELWIINVDCENSLGGNSIRGNLVDRVACAKTGIVESCYPRTRFIL